MDVSRTHHRPLGLLRTFFLFLLNYTSPLGIIEFRNFILRTLGLFSTAPVIALKSPPFECLVVKKKKVYRGDAVEKKVEAENKKQFRRRVFVWVSCVILERLIIHPLVLYEGGGVNETS